MATKLQMNDDGTLNDRLLKPAEAAKLLGITPAALNWDRCRRERPVFPYIELAPKTVRYRLSSILRAIETREVGSVGA